jgi:regulator of sirC expression with transglutaminase-like and TPR domain
VTAPFARHGLDPEVRARLEAIAAAGEADIDIAGTALLLAACDRPRVPLERYHEHLDQLARDVATAVGSLGEAAGAAERASALGAVIAGTHDYAGDDQTYDDLQNANLMRVIDRRRGLPVALGILYIHAARAQGWGAGGLAFPNHFLIRVDVAGERVVLDPFNDGATVGVADMRALLKRFAGADAELEPGHWALVPDRAILLRLLNNLKLRLAAASRHPEALAVIDRMATLAPEESSLLRERGLLQAHLGEIVAALESLGRFIETGDGGEAERHHVARMIQTLKGRLN